MRRRFILVGLFALLFGLGWWAGRGGASNDLYSRIDTFVEILHKVEESYVEPVEPERLIGGAVHGMLRDLDPFAEYVVTQGPAATGPAPHGDADPGLALGVRDNAWVVIAPVSGGPADRAGVRAEDVLLQVDGRSTGGWSSTELASRLRGPKGSRVRLSLLRAGDDAPRDIVVTRAALARDPAVLAAARPSGELIEKGVGCIRLVTIGDSTAAEVAALMRHLREQGATRLALDLRGATSGTPHQALAIAQLFLPHGTTVAITHGRGREADHKLIAGGASPTLDWPLTVLIDGTCAGASEVIAGALQDQDRALLIGRRTFGLASEQSDFPLEGGHATIRITTSIELTPSGRPIQKLVQTEGDDEEDSSDSDSTSTDREPARAFATHAGRKILGGGGIRPDLEVPPATSTVATAVASAPVTKSSTDPVLRRAVTVLLRAHAPRDVFAALPRARSSTEDMAALAEGRRH
ncbi:MAG TPA: S41 family peptidase [Candidatus Udaeobacter sp.]|jgi:carboxyl-terminal processing protease|nr:S41 family peptidase [Candidatus Udaeobacter sp.]